MKIIQMLVGPMAVFCYLVVDEKTREGIIIDPAGSEDKITEVFDKERIKLKYIINTHGHADHTGGNELLRRRLKKDVPVVMHTHDVELSQRPEAQEFAQMIGLYPCLPPDIQVQDGDKLHFGELTAKFLHTPGHSPGSCCILIENNLFTGDTLFVGSVGRTDLPGGSLSQLLESIKRKILTLPPDTIVWPGHDYGDKPCSTIAREMRTNPYITDFILDHDE